MITETYEQAANRLGADLPVPIDHPESRVWLRWSDKTLQPFPGDQTAGEWRDIAAANAARTMHLEDD